MIDKPNLDVNDVGALKAERDKIKEDIDFLMRKLDAIGVYYAQSAVMCILLIVGGTLCLLSAVQIGIELSQSAGSLFDGVTVDGFKSGLLVLDSALAVLDAALLGTVLTRTLNRKNELLMLVYSNTDILNSFNMRIRQLEDERKAKAGEEEV